MAPPTQLPLPHLDHAHAGKKIVWGAPGKDAATLDEFFADLRCPACRPARGDQHGHGAGVRHERPGERGERGGLRIDPYHCFQLVTEALDVERRQAVWNELRQLPDQQAAKTFTGSRWVLLKRPENLTTDQTATLRELRNRGGAVWRAYSLKEAFRAILASDLDEHQTAQVPDR